MISYKPLRDLLYENRMVLNDLVTEKILTPNNASYINNDTGHISIRTLEKILPYLSHRLSRVINVEDVIRYVPGQQEQDQPKDED